jgi:hypothetical protein
LQYADGELPQIKENKEAKKTKDSYMYLSMYFNHKFFNYDPHDIDGRKRYKRRLDHPIPISLAENCEYYGKDIKRDAVTLSKMPTI